MSEPKYHNTAGHPRIGSSALLKEQALAEVDHLLRVAVIIRALADEVVPYMEIKPQENLESRREAMIWGMDQQTQLTRQKILAIASELEKSNV